ncbi:MAG: hypothetical protein ACI9WU_004896 [Myxococcota bacterium]
MRGRRVGLLAHHASFTADLRFAVEALQSAGANVVRLLGPEHGLWGAAQDMIPVDGGVDRWTGLPVVSLYGHDQLSLRPDPMVLDGLDVLVCDLQDVGARYYTYAATAAMTCEVAAEIGLEVLVCDRPNPIGGAIEGNTVQPELFSFVGQYPAPQRHGLTIAELVRTYTGGLGTPIPMEGYRRGMWFDETGLPWIPPSPNMPTLGAATVYPGMCKLEGCTLSEGRGSTTPFELFGAPWIDPFRLAGALRDSGLEGVAFRPHVFEPTFQKHAREACGGVQIIVTQREALRPVRLGIEILCTLQRLWPEKLAWRTEVYEFEHNRLAIDLLLGVAGRREALEAGASVDELTADFAQYEAAWREQSQPWRLYD